MPSPFPGMDPYLESPRWFPGLHNNFITFLQAALQLELPEPYYAATGELIWLECSRRYVEPDVDVLRSGSAPRGRPAEGAVAALEPMEPVVVTVEAAAEDERREPFLEIYARREGEDRLVTAIEVLSPANKAAGSRGRETYLSKQGELLDGRVHVVEIDLLRGGTHTTAVPRELAVARAGPFAYHVSVHRFDRPDDFLVYPIRLEQRLPVIAVPLLPGDPDVPLDLQAAFDRAYEVGPYRRTVRYGRDTPEPPLIPQQLDWAARVVGGVR